MQGYWGDPSVTSAAVTPDGWIVTGDLGRFDQRGYLTLAGRTTEMYIRGGYNIYPVEVEAVLAEHPGVLQAAVVGAPDPVLGEVGVAFVTLAALPDGSVPPEGWRHHLREWCASRLADYKSPDVVEVVAELPLTAMSKVDKRALAERAAILAGQRQV